jgi:hypothetical protein
MTIAQLLSSLFNLGAQNGPLTSIQAARDFWTIFAIIGGMLVATIAIRSTNHDRPARHH